MGCATHQIYVSGFARTTLRPESLHWAGFINLRRQPHKDTLALSMHGAPGASRIQG